MANPKPPNDAGRAAPGPATPPPGQDQRQGQERASGTIDRPIGTDDAQPGDRAERGAEFGGPIDVFPTRRDRTGIEDPNATDEPEAEKPR